MVDLDDIYKIQDNLYIGAYWPQLNFKKIEKEGITAIVNLMEESLYDPIPKGYHYLHKGFPDDTYPPQNYIKEILEFLDIHTKRGKVLVHCAMGISRSGGLIVAWLLKENPKWSWNDALSYVNNVRLIFPAIEIRESVLDYLESLEGFRRQI